MIMCASSARCSMECPNLATASFVLIEAGPDMDFPSNSRTRSATVSGNAVMTSGRQVGNDMVVLGIGAAVLGVGLAALLAAKGESSKQGATRIPAARTAAPLPVATVTAARRLNRAAGMLAFSVLADSSMEHYRGSFFNSVMYTPLVVSALALAASAHGVADQRPAAHFLRDFIYSATAVTGVVGTGFHLHNVISRPGGFSWQNLFYGAPLGAPTAILLSGLLGFMAERLRKAKSGSRVTFLGIPAERMTAGIAAGGLLGTAGEAGLLHFRGAYHNPFMFMPVVIPPAAAVVMAEIAVGPSIRNRAFSRWWLRLTAALGIAGVGFHAYGIHRNMGGWRNWRQNLLNGPPLPAPPSFTGLALAGLAALALLEDGRHA
jgi:hypothetical protein